MPPAVGGGVAQGPVCHLDYQEPVRGSSCVKSQLVHGLVAPLSADTCQTLIRIHEHVGLSSDIEVRLGFVFLKIPQKAGFVNASVSEYECWDSRFL